MEWLGRFSAFMCKMLNAMHCGPHLGPSEYQMLFFEHLQHIWFCSGHGLWESYKHFHI